jgi:hypothetical protein
MQTNLIWKKGLFSNLYNIYSKGELIGNLKEKTFSQSGVGVLFNKEYLFQTKGFLNKRTEIIDKNENKVIGEIDYNNWMTKATITVNNKTISWKYDNFLNTKWSLIDTEGLNIKFSGSSTKGHIYSNVEDSLLILSGLFITNYYWQMTIAIVIAALVPIWVTMS